jgi:DNA-binding CsgD family transcriptional regulator/tetratricopeptide (TPR) repeat protein
MATSTLLERDAEVDLLESLVDDLDGSGGKVVLIRGEAGIGKSSLVEAFLERVEERAHVLRGGCDDLLIPQPLTPFWDMARTEPTIEEPLDAMNRPRVLEAVLDLMSRALRPTVIVIEDTQWADEGTLDSIKYLGRRIARTNTLLVLTYRDGAVDREHPLRTVVGDLPVGSVVRLNLTGLSIDAIETLVAHAGLDADEVMAATDGNPLLIEQMAAAGAEGAAMSLEDLVMTRVGRLSDGAQELLRAMSVIPEPIPVSDALALLDIDESLLQEAETAGLLAIEDAWVAFKHELIRRTVEASLSATERLAQHRIVLDGLPEETHPCLLINSAAQAGDVDRLLVLAPRSARSAAKLGSHQQSVEDFRELREHLDRFDPDELGAILIEWAEEEYFTGNLLDAAALAEQAIDHHAARGETSELSRAYCRGAHFYENAGQPDRAEEFAARAVEVLGPDPAPEDLVRALDITTFVRLMTGHIDEVAELADRVLEVGGDDIDERFRIRAIAHRGVAADVAKYPAGRTLLEEAARRAEVAGEWYEQCRALANHGGAALDARDLPTARDYLQRTIDAARRREMRHPESFALASLARVSEFAGEWEQAEDLIDEVGEGDPRLLAKMTVTPLLGVLAARRGESTARDTILQTWEMTRGTHRSTPSAAAFAEYAWITGDDSIPIDEFVAVIERDASNGLTFEAGQVAFWVWKLGRLDAAPNGIADPYRLSIEGRAEEAAELWDELGLPYEAAMARSGGSFEDRLAALEVVEALGATAVAAKLRQGLRADGVKVPRGKAATTRKNRAGLTARQNEVLQLLGEGLSNPAIADRLFVSSRTVENHVAAVLRKLEAPNREMAVRVAAEQGLLTA